MPCELLGQNLGQGVNGPRISQHRSLTTPSSRAQPPRAACFSLRGHHTTLSWVSQSTRSSGLRASVKISANGPCPARHIRNREVGRAEEIRIVPQDQSVAWPDLAAPSILLWFSPIFGMTANDLLYLLSLMPRPECNPGFGDRHVFRIPLD